jgi:RHS repeat-associated protein
VNCPAASTWSDSNGDAGDKYTGLDRFDRVVDQRWIKTSTGVATDRFQYLYDRDGNRLYKNNLVNAAFSELYHANGANGYDNLNQITTFARGTLSASVVGGPLDTISSSSTSQSWSLDVMGNFASQTTNGTAVSRTHNKQNEITTVGSATLAYDANGNMTTDEAGRTLVYDSWNRLVQIKDASGNTLFTYAYDTLGRRISETVPGTPSTTTDLYYSAAWQVLEERVSGSWTAQYVWSPIYIDALILRDRPSERLWVQQDANWNVTSITDTSGTVVNRFVYYPYGGVAIYDGSWNILSSNTLGWKYLFQGGRYDWISLYSFRNRDYSASLGRWSKNDPLGFAAGDTNLYRANSDRPTESRDPSGLDGVDDIVNFFGPQNILGWDRYLGDRRTGWFNGFSNFSAGMGDTVSFGLTRRARQAGGGDPVDYNSGSYHIGGYVGNAVQIGFAFTPYGWIYFAIGAPAMIWNIADGVSDYRQAGFGWWGAIGMGLATNLPIVSSGFAVAEIGEGQSLRAGDYGQPLDGWGYADRLVWIGSDLIVMSHYTSGRCRGRAPEGGGTGEGSATQVRPPAGPTQPIPQAGQTEPMVPGSGAVNTGRPVIRQPVPPSAGPDVPGAGVGGVRVGGASWLSEETFNLMRERGFLPPDLQYPPEWRNPGAGGFPAYEGY